MVGRTIGKYRIVEQIGRGGMGTVYKAVDETLDRTVAIKVLNADLLNQDSVERFRREAVMLARLSHPRIGAIHELTRDDHDLLMVMEFIGGETFERLVERLGTITIPQACRLCIQVLEGLQYAHNAGVVHRDLKPANLIVMPSGDVKIMDFGIARMQGSEHLTSVGFMVGTPAYMSPEQVRGEEVDPRMDLYSIAVVLYRLLTHHLPFQGDTAIALIHSQLNNPPTPPRQFRADLPEWIVATLSRGLAKGRGDRFQTAEEFRAALEGGLTGTMPIPAILGPSAAETIGPTPTPPQMRVPMVSAGTPSGAPVPSPRAAGDTPSQRPAGAMPPPVSALPPSMIAAQPVLPTAAPPLGQTPSRPMVVPGQTPSPQAIPSAARAEATVTLRAPHLATAGILLVALVAGIAVLAVVALRRPTIVTQAPAVTTAPPSATPAPVAPATSVPPVTAAPGGPVSTPSGRAAVTPPTVTASPAPPVASSAPPATAPRPTPGPTATTNPAGAAAGRSTDMKASEPSPGRSTAASATSPTGAVSAPPSPTDAPSQHFPDVKSLVVDGQRVREVDALLSLEPASLVVRLRDEGTVLRMLPYRAITAATYTRGRRPRGQAAPNAAAIPENFGGSGFLGGARHWLTLQTAGEFVVVRLEDRNVIRVMNGIESRTGLKVQRTDN